MKREIKFRAWDTMNKQMFGLTGFHIIGEVTMFGIIDEWCMEEPNGKMLLERYGDIEVMQFTGLKDKNGKEIYEGDMLRQSSILPDEYPRVIKIIWRDGGFMYCNYLDSCFYFYQSMCNQCEIIGNIYENPELLSPEQKSMPTNSVDN